MEPKDILLLAKAVSKKVNELIPESSESDTKIGFIATLLKLVSSRHDQLLKLTEDQKKVNRECYLILTCPEPEKKMELLKSFIQTKGNEKLDQITKSSSRKEKSSPQQMESVARKAIKWGFGNCGEKAGLAYLLFAEVSDENIALLNMDVQEIPQSISVELLIVIHKRQLANHQVVLLNRDPNTDIHDPRTWNKDTIICDAFINACYFIGEIFQDKNDIARNQWTGFMFDDVTQNIFITGKPELGSDILPKNFIGNTSIHSNEWKNKYKGNFKLWKSPTLIGLNHLDLDKAREAQRENYRSKYHL